MEIPTLPSMQRELEKRFKIADKGMREIEELTEEVKNYSYPLKLEL